MAPNSHLTSLGSHERKPATRAEEMVYWFLMGHRYSASRERIEGKVRGIIIKHVTLING